MATFCCECGNKLPTRRVKNPHNAKDEFCSQDCAKASREKYLENGPKNYLLYAEGSAVLLGIFKTMPDLMYGATYQRDIHRVNKETLGKLFYEVWVDNYPESKEWAYIPEITVTSFRKT
jgi:hypothetical protein